MDQGKESLAGIALFRDLPARDVESLARVCAWRRYPAGQQILGHLDENTDVYFIAEGTLRVVIYSLAGKEVSFGELDPGTTFGEIAAIDGRPRSATIVALSDALVASMSAEAFKETLARHPEVAAKVLERLAELVRSLSNRVFEFSVLAVRNRIHAELLRLARRHGVEGNRAVISPAPTHSEIASRVSTHREAVTRELNALAKDGLIARREGALAISDVARLARMVEEVTGA